MFYNLKKQKNMVNNISPFIEKLQQIINDPNNEDTIRYNEESLRLEIFSKKRLENILSKYFRHARFQSFVRQLNWYGFYKINNKSANCYSHPDLERGGALSNIKSRRKTLTQKRIEGSKVERDPPMGELQGLVNQQCQRQVPKIVNEQKINLIPLFQMPNNIMLYEPYQINFVPVNSNPYQNFLYVYR